jgi:transcriptional regulator with XRE-family HTH domain
LTPEAKKGIGDRIRHARINAKMKQYDTAEKIGVSRAAVSNWELGLGYWRASVDHLATFPVVAFREFDIASLAA